MGTDPSYSDRTGWITRLLFYYPFMGFLGPNRVLMHLMILLYRVLLGFLPMLLMFITAFTVVLTNASDVYNQCF